MVWTLSQMLRAPFVSLMSPPQGPFVKQENLTQCGGEPSHLPGFLASTLFHPRVLFPFASLLTHHPPLEDHLIPGERWFQVELRLETGLFQKPCPSLCFLKPAFHGETWEPRGREKRKAAGLSRKSAVFTKGVRQRDVLE